MSNVKYIERLNQIKKIDLDKLSKSELHQMYNEITSMLNWWASVPTFELRISGMFSRHDEMVNLRKNILVVLKNKK
jgi:hypothetical protein